MQWFGEFNLLRRQVAINIVRELLTEHQDAEGRAQLVRHVGQELGLVLEVKASSLAFSSNAPRACSISWFLRSIAFCSASC